MRVAMHVKRVHARIAAQRAYEVASRRAYK
jgi:hypothetical protein